MVPQTWDPEQYQKHAAFVPALGAPLIGLLAPQPGQRVLDLGCGDGVLTRELVRAGCEVVAVDQSPAQVAAARQRGIDARVMDGESLDFEGEFDAVFSNAALHWMKDAPRVLAGVARALRPGGRFVAEFGGEGNIAAIRAALVTALARRGIDGEARVPWYFPSEQAYTAELARAGFALETSALFARATDLPGDVTGWLETMAQVFAQALPPGERAAYFAEVRQLLAPKLQRADGSWWADYVRLRISARKA